MSKSTYAGSYFTITLILFASVLPAQEPRPSEEVLPTPVPEPSPLPQSATSAPMVSGPVVETPPSNFYPEQDPIVSQGSPPVYGATNGTTAVLRVHVDEDAAVTINGHPTNKNMHSGGSRKFTLTQLDPFAATPILIEVRLADGRQLTPRSLTIFSKNTYEETFDSTRDLVPAPIVEMPVNVPDETMEQLNGLVGGLQDSSSNLATVTADLAAIKKLVDQSKAVVEAAGKTVDVSNEQIETAKKLTEAATTIKDSFKEFKAELGLSTKSLTTSEKKITDSATAAAKKLETLLNQLNATLELMPTPETRSYELQSGKELQAMLAHNEDKQIRSITFVADQLVDTLDFVDGNKWRLNEVAKNGTLHLSLQVRLEGEEEPVDFTPDDESSHTVDIEFESLDNPNAEVPFKESLKNSVQKWIEDTVKKNPKATEKLTLEHNVTELLITGTFARGFAQGVPLAKPLKIEILEE